jgi:hypothetical protein
MSKLLKPEPSPEIAIAKTLSSKMPRGMTLAPFDDGYGFFGGTKRIELLVEKRSPFLNLLRICTDAFSSRENIGPQPCFAERVKLIVLRMETEMDSTNPIDCYVTVFCFVNSVERCRDLLNEKYAFDFAIDEFIRHYNPFDVVLASSVCAVYFLSYLIRVGLIRLGEGGQLAKRA